MEESIIEFRLGDCVIHKYFGRGRVDQLRNVSSISQYHVQFEKVACWCPAGDLHPETDAALAGPRRDK